MCLAQAQGSGCWAPLTLTQAVKVSGHSGLLPPGAWLRARIYREWTLEGSIDLLYSILMLKLHVVDCILVHKWSCSLNWRSCSVISAFCLLPFMCDRTACFLLYRKSFPTMHYLCSINALPSGPTGSGFYRLHNKINYVKKMNNYPRQHKNASVRCFRKNTSQLVIIYSW